MDAFFVWEVPPLCFTNKYILSLTSTSSPPQEAILFLATFCRAKNDPRYRNSGFGLLSGCELCLDQVSVKKDSVAGVVPAIKIKKENRHRLFGYPIAIDRAWSNESGRMACCLRESRTSRSVRRQNFRKKRPKSTRHFGPKF